MFASPTRRWSRHGTSLYACMSEDSVPSACPWVRAWAPASTACSVCALGGRVRNVHGRITGRAMARSTTGIRQPRTRHLASFVHHGPTGKDPQCFERGADERMLQLAPAVPICLCSPSRTVARGVRVPALLAQRTGTTWGPPRTRLVSLGCLNARGTGSRAFV